MSLARLFPAASGGVATAWAQRLPSLLCRTGQAGACFLAPGTLHLVGTDPWFPHLMHGSGSLSSPP